MPRVPIGPVHAVSDRTCLAIADGDAVVVRVGAEVRAFQGHCLHQDSSLDGAWVRDGVLTCPLHVWRYRVIDGRHLGTDRRLEQYPVEIVDGEAVVVLPDPSPPTSLREQLLARARSYDRARQFERERSAEAVPEPTSSWSSENWCAVQPFC